MTAGVTEARRVLSTLTQIDFCGQTKSMLYIFTYKSAEANWKIVSPKEYSRLSFVLINLLSWFCNVGTKEEKHHAYAVPNAGAVPLSLKKKST